MDVEGEPGSEVSVFGIKVKIRADGIAPIIVSDASVKCQRGGNAQCTPFFCADFWKQMTKMYAERIRSKYLLPFIETLGRKIADLTTRAADLSTAERKKLDTLNKQLEECREYHDRLAVVAEQAIPLDLDDGVVVNYAKLGDVVSKLK